MAFLLKLTDDGLYDQVLRGVCDNDTRFVS